MSKIFPSILKGSDHAYTPLDGEEESTDGDEDEELSDIYEPDSTDEDTDKEE